MLLVFIFAELLSAGICFYSGYPYSGIYLFTGTGNAFSSRKCIFRDIQYIYSAFLTAWMYVTPIFYPLSQLPENLQTAIKTFNPLYTYITQFRTIVLDVSLPGYGNGLYGFVVASITLGSPVHWSFKESGSFYPVYLIE